MAVTRASTNSSRPRIFDAITPSSSHAHKKGTTAKGTKTSTTGSRVTKKSTTTTKKAPATHHKRKPHLTDKVAGAVEKVVGKIEHKPGKEAAGTKRMRGTDGRNSRGGATTRGRGRARK